MFIYCHVSYDLACSLNSHSSLLIPLDFVTHIIILSESKIIYFSSSMFMPFILCLKSFFFMIHAFKVLIFSPKHCFSCISQILIFCVFIIQYKIFYKFYFISSLTHDELAMCSLISKCVMVFPVLIYY